MRQKCIDFLRAANSGEWLLARNLADEISMICLSNYHIEHPVIHLRRVHPRSLAPRDRVWRALRRVSRGRIIYAKEANKIIWKMCQKWSGQPHSTFQATRLPEENGLRSNTKLINGSEGYDNLTPWRELQTEARKAGAQFCEIEKKRQQTLHWLWKLEQGSLETKSFINQLKKELINVQNAH